MNDAAFAIQHWKEGARRVFGSWFFFFSFGISYCQVTGLRMPLVYKLFLQTSVVTFVKCLLLSLLKVKTMKYYLNCNPRKCPKTTCPSLESCQNKERAKVKPENNNWRLPHAASLPGGAHGLHPGFQLLGEDLHLFSSTHMGVLGFEVNVSNSLIVAMQHFFKEI